MFKALHNLFKQLSEESSSSNATVNNDFESSMAALLCEVASADNDINEKESLAKIHQLSMLLNIDTDRASALLATAKKDSEDAVSIYQFTSKLRDIEYQQRFVLIESMWHVAYADGVIDPHEEALIRQVADLIYITHSDYIRAKLAAHPEPS